MTREEFIQEAALRLITSRPDADCVSIAVTAKELANEIYGEQIVKKPEVQSCLTTDEPIDNLIREIDRIDEERVRKTNEELKSEGYWRRSQKGGYAETVSKVCIVNNFNHVFDLVNFGRVSFRRQRSIGEKCTEAVDKALYNLYHIKNW